MDVFCSKGLSKKRHRPLTDADHIDLAEAAKSYVASLTIANASVAHLTIGPETTAPEQCQLLLEKLAQNAELLLS
ncbi:hypothetical protein V202x_08640 [Gimesia aquarii]|uniref:Uncharacterized protein n=1 Tax=Gimesia aquarii TaxID=2527964 RepID=A0A517WQI0_9PLAN|nr:hypothetical protein V202x_08640 [Gimesia aquarii]